MSVSGPRSSASATGCVFSDSAQTNVCVYEGAAATLTGCFMRGAKGLHGMQVGLGGALYGRVCCEGLVLGFCFWAAGART